MSKSAVERWTSKMLLKMGPEGASLSRIVIRHATGGSRAPAVGEVSVDAARHNATKLAAEVWELAEGDAEGLGGLVQRYVAHAYFGACEEPDPNRCTIRVQREEEEGASGLDSEPADARGMVAQSMRHNEALARISLGASQGIFNQMTRLIEMQGQQLAEAHTRMAEMREAAEDVTDRRLEREAMRRAEEREDKRDAALLGSLQALVPIVLSKLAGGGAPAPGAQRPEDMVVNQLLGSITPDQLAKLQGILKPEQVLLFLSAYENRVLDQQAPAAPAPAPMVLAGVNGHNGHRGSA